METSLAAEPAPARDSCFGGSWPAGRSFAEGVAAFNPILK